MGYGTGGGASGGGGYGGGCGGGYGFHNIAFILFLVLILLFFGDGFYGGYSVEK